VSKFELILDSDRRLLTVVMRGFWDARVYHDYDVQLSAQLLRLRQLKGSQACLVDARDFAVQPRDVADLLRDGIAKRLHLYPERTVRLVSCALSRSQAARMTNSGAHRVYDSMDEALGWLLEQRSVAA